VCRLSIELRTTTTNYEMCPTTNRRIHRKTYMAKWIYTENLTCPVNQTVKQPQVCFTVASRFALSENGHKDHHANNGADANDKQYFRCNEFCSVHEFQKR
jgi:hypothetical protein